MDVQSLKNIEPNFDGLSSFLGRTQQKWRTFTVKFWGWQKKLKVWTNHPVRQGPQPIEIHRWITELYYLWLQMVKEIKWEWMLPRLLLPLRVTHILGLQAKSERLSFICCLSVHPSVQLSFLPTICPSAHLFICPSVHLSVLLSLCLSFYLAVCPSVRPSV